MGRDPMFMRHPTLDWDGFMEDLNILLQREKLVYNPVKNKLCDWIDVDKLHCIFRRYAVRKHPTLMTSHRSMSTRNVSTGIGEHRNHHRIQHLRQSSMKQPSLDRRHSLSNPKREQSANHHHRQTLSTSLNESSQSHQRRQPVFAASMREPCVSGPNRRTTFHVGEASPSSTHHCYRRNPSPCSEVHLGQKNMSDLKLVIQSWSHRAPKQLRPLETLLVEIPTLFPATNPLVEHHDYFSRWKEFSADAFEGESGEELKELLTRAVRKAKVR